MDVAITLLMTICALGNHSVCFDKKLPVSPFVAYGEVGNTVTETADPRKICNRTAQEVMASPKRKIVPPGAFIKRYACVETKHLLAEL